jgi:hypothetical protein
MSAVREKKCGVSDEIIVILHVLFFRKMRAVVTPAMPLPMMMTCSIEFKVILSPRLIGHA